MTAPYYEDDLVTLHHGDCLDVLRDLPDASVDAVVTDPPYGLEFMGKAWDRFDEDSNARAGMSSTGYTDGAERLERPSHMGGLNPKCRNCQKWQRGGNPCACDRPDFPNERRARSAAFGDWCELWTAECLRVLKPGGHLLAFGGTRTWHRLACAVEDAGFEVRDSIAWMYGSGFPKSLDVSKAIDKAAGAEREVVGPSLRHVSGKPEQRTEGLNGSGTFSESVGMGAFVTAPATAAARTWQGWGTALKPAFEPVVVARKPLGGAIDVRARVEHELRQRGVEEIAWIRPASDAASPDLPTSSSSTRAQPMAATSADPAGESETANGARSNANDSGPRTTPGTRPTPNWSQHTAHELVASSATPSSTPTAANAPAAVSGTSSSSPSTTSTEAAPLTGSRSTARSTPSSADSASLPAIGSFAGIATGLTGSLAHVLISRTAAGFIWPDDLPEVVTPGSTVAANVLAYGTGALNIDGCRIAGNDNLVRPAIMRDDNDVLGKGLGAGVQENPAGRWPANVVLDESQATALDQQSGESASKRSNRGELADMIRGRYNAAEGTIPGSDYERGHDDQGGASRFFYVAKADASERVRVADVAHPTVKPLALMRWLVRLVTPPGGTVLEPFAGSGTTVEACILENLHCIAIEREADYLPLIVQRINRRRDPVAAVRSSGDDAGLFDLLDEDTA